MLSMVLTISENQACVIHAVGFDQNNIVPETPLHGFLVDVVCKVDINVRKADGIEVYKFISIFLNLIYHFDL